MYDNIELCWTGHVAQLRKRTVVGTIGKSICKEEATPSVASLVTRILLL